jgi:hypothetical protein
MTSEYARLTSRSSSTMSCSYTWPQWQNTTCSLEISCHLDRHSETFHGAGVAAKSRKPQQAWAVAESLTRIKEFHEERTNFLIFTN